jgi:sialidase-1
LIGRIIDLIIDMNSGVITSADSPRLYQLALKNMSSNRWSRFPNPRVPGRPLVLLSLALAAGRIAAAAPPLPEKIQLFQAGEGGYKLYRIPGVVVTRRGTVLAYCEACRHTGGDWDTIDLLLRRSTDGGRTFSAPVLLPRPAGDIRRNPVAIERKQGRPDDVTYNNPVAIADRSGAVHFLFCVEYMRVFYMRSDDDGQTFTQPVEITSAFDAFRPEYDWRVVATGPGHGIQLSAGRLIVPVWLALGTEGNGHGPSANATVYSDDHGATWRRGALAIAGSAEFPNANEATVAELADGRVMLNARTPARQNRRAVAISDDGATAWSRPRFQQDLPDPICAAGLLRFSTVKTGGKNRLLFSNPDNLTRADGKEAISKDRRNLTVRLSYDEGASWPVKRLLESGPAGYSDLAVLPDATILCFYEAVAPTSARVLNLARFKLEWLTEGADSLNELRNLKNQ